MICPRCKGTETQVLDSRDCSEGVRRRRECLSCQYRFTTYERIELPNLTVIKKNGDKERFQGEKIRRGVTTACKNRPISEETIDDLIEEIERELALSGTDSVTSVRIGEMVQERLKSIDEVAYVRFASVCQSFDKASDFTSTVKDLK